LVIVVLFITLASLAVRFVEYMWDPEGIITTAMRLLNVGEENSIATWYSSSALLLCSVLLATIAVANKRHGNRYTIEWVLLSAVFLLLSVDEVAQIHEETTVEAVASKATGLEPSGFLYHLWVVPGIVFVIVVLLASLRLLANLPGRIRRWFLAAGTLFVLGALGMEVLSARVLSKYGENWENVGGIPKIVVGVQTSIEELLEMLGVVAFIYALLLYASYYMKEIDIRIRADE